MVLAKVVMVGGLFHFGRALEKKPLILATLFNSFLFTIWVALFAAIESALRGLFHGLGFAGALDHLLSEGAHEFYAKCLVVFVAFIPFLRSRNWVGYSARARYGNGFSGRDRSKKDSCWNKRIEA
jgi:surface polysaccharide O-acyltransferase-like enzyme